VERYAIQLLAFRKPGSVAPFARRFGVEGRVLTFYPGTDIAEPLPQPAQAQAPAKTNALQSLFAGRSAFS
jgi:hypothetical protein